MHEAEDNLSAAVKESNSYFYRSKLSFLTPTTHLHFEIQLEIQSFLCIFFTGRDVWVNPRRFADSKVNGQIERTKLKEEKFIVCIRYL